MQLGEKTSEERSVSQKWENYLKEKGAEKLWQGLKDKDTKAERKIKRTNRRKTNRGIRDDERTGNKISRRRKKK